MADTVTLDAIEYRIGEEKPVRVTITDVSGANLSSLTATGEIWTSAGVLLSGPTACTMSGTTTRVAQYQITTGTGKTIAAAGEYRAVIRSTYGAVIREWQVPLHVLALPDRAATYVLTTDVGQLRLIIQDVDMTDPRWTDAELEVFLQQAADSSPISDLAKYYIAASKIMLAQAADQAPASNMLKLGIFQDNEKPVFDAYVQMSKTFARLAGVGYSSSPPDKAFTLDYGDGTTTGTTHIW